MDSSTRASRRRRAQGRAAYVPAVCVPAAASLRRAGARRRGRPAWPAQPVGQLCSHPLNATNAPFPERFPGRPILFGGTPSCRYPVPVTAPTRPSPTQATPAPPGPRPAPAPGPGPGPARPGPDLKWRSPECEITVRGATPRAATRQFLPSRAAWAPQSMDVVRQDHSMRCARPPLPNPAQPCAVAAHRCQPSAQASPARQNAP